LLVISYAASEVRRQEEGVEPLLLQVRGGKYNVIKIETETVNSHILFFIPGQPAKSCKPQRLLIKDLEQIQTADSGAVRTQPLSSPVYPLRRTEVTEYLYANFHKNTSLGIYFVFFITELGFCLNACSN